MSSRRYLTLFIVLVTMALSDCSSLEELDKERRGDTSLGTFDEPEEPSQLERRKNTNAFLKFEKQLESGKISRRLLNSQEDDQDEDGLIERLASLDLEKRFNAAFTKQAYKAAKSQQKFARSMAKKFIKMGNSFIRHFG